MKSQWSEMIKRGQIIKVEAESLKKTKTECLIQCSVAVKRCRGHGNSYSPKKAFNWGLLTISKV